MNASLLARGATPIDLDRPRLLFFDKSAAWALRERFGPHYRSALFEAHVNGKLVDVELKSMEALEFFLCVGLQRDAAEHGETLTLEAAGDFIMPATEQEIFFRVVTAFTRGIHTPPAPGKEGAAAAGPAVAAEEPASRKASTSRRRSALPSPASGKRRSGSGRRR